jgi:hypothetical protein
MPQGIYTIAYKGKQILDDSKLGIVRSDEDFSQNLKAIKISAPVTVKDNYTMLIAKKKKYHLYRCAKNYRNANSFR